MNFSGAMRSVLRQYVTFSGRAGRPEFWWWYLATILVNLITARVDALTDATIGISLVGPVVSLALLLPTLAVSARRLHDSNLSGWWLLAPIGVALVGFGLLVMGLVAVLLPSFVDNAPEGSGLAIAFVASGALVLLISLVLGLVLMLRRSTPGPNRYGPVAASPHHYPPTEDPGHPTMGAPSPWTPPVARP